VLKGNDLQSAIENEKRSLERAVRDLVDVSRFIGCKQVEGQYSVLANELRHYDALSYWALLGMAGVASYLFATSLRIESVLLAVLQYSLCVVLLVGMGYLYQRLARTAASARNVMKAIELVFGFPGISAASMKLPLFSKGSYIANILIWLGRSIVTAKWFGHLKPGTQITVKEIEYAMFVYGLSVAQVIYILSFLLVFFAVTKMSVSILLHVLRGAFC
jgi:hypothetical protein